MIFSIKHILIVHVNISPRNVFLLKQSFKSWSTTAVIYQPQKRWQRAVGVCVGVGFGEFDIVLGVPGDPFWMYFIIGGVACPVLVNHENSDISSSSDTCRCVVFTPRNESSTWSPLILCVLSKRSRYMCKYWRRFVTVLRLLLPINTFGGREGSTLVGYFLLSWLWNAKNWLYLRCTTNEWPLSNWTNTEYTTKVPFFFLPVLPVWWCFFADWIRKLRIFLGNFCGGPFLRQRVFALDSFSTSLVLILHCYQKSKDLLGPFFLLWVLVFLSWLANSVD